MKMMMSHMRKLFLQADADLESIQRPLLNWIIAKHLNASPFSADCK